ncbi:hypothetical protein CDV31_010765 [Fusarium ambrosium]|uniref:Uncharacterized protein n=1 Tax=Fusarium ambrosium TaxID=131363 RepID=A0A428TLA1_9HYPO|nr:hypothetical protein CDV31_010765 [Fusarium ambrosium]
MSGNQKNTALEKKDDIVPASGDETVPPTNPFMGACRSIGFLPLLEPPLADQTEPSQGDILDQAVNPNPESIPQPPEESQKQDDFFDTNGGLKNCPGAFPVDEPEVTDETPTQVQQEEDDFFDANGGLKNCPGAFPVDEPEGTDKAPKMGEQVQQKESDKSREKQE